MEPLNRLASQLHDLYRSMTPGSRLVTGLAALAVFLGLGYLGTHPSNGEYVDLMHGVPVAVARLPLMEAAFAKANLTGYDIRGTSIHVPRDQSPAYMAALVAAGVLPPQPGSYEGAAGNADNPFVSTAQRDLRMKTAKQSELALAISAMPGIEWASVLYDIDKAVGFREKTITASVNVKPTGTGQLDESRVSAIRHLVAGAIAGLKPENVTVSDLNGRTWYGELNNAGEVESSRLSLQRAAEQELKAKILSALSFIPNVTVEARVVCDGPRNGLVKESTAATPTTACVSVGVPCSYFKKVWRERNPDVADHAIRASDGAALDRIRSEESARIARHVAPLLPPSRDVADPSALVTVTMFQDLPAQSPVALNLGQDILAWARQSWRTLAWIGLALAALVALRSMFRVPPAAVKTQLELPVDSVSPVSDAQSPPVPAPHWRRRPEADDLPLRKQLSQLVDDDPETATNILRNWIGQAN